MNPLLPEMNEDLEAERYELHTGEPSYRFELDRRNFCRTMGGGLLVMLLLPRISEAQEREESGRRGRGGFSPELGAWIRIDPDGKIHAYTGKAEVGQGTRTMLCMVVADELCVPLNAVTITMADTDVSPYDRGTFGSRSTPDMVPQLRRAAAATREALIDLAAQDWQLPREQITLKAGAVQSADGARKATFADLTKSRALTRQITAEENVIPAGERALAGKPTPAQTSLAMVTGTHQYPSDHKVEGMLYGRILRPSAFDHELASADTSETEKLPDVTVVRDQKFIGVVAPTAARAKAALATIKAEWTPPATPPPSEDKVFEFFKANQSEPTGGWGGSTGGQQGNASQALATAANKVEATYSLPYIAHVPLETRSALAQWDADKLTVWVGSQRPFGIRSELAQAFSIPEDRVRVVTPDTGSGYGGKHTGEVALEAARLAKGARKPVKLIWSREEEFTWAYFRPAGIMELKAGADADGKLVAWEHHNWNSGGSGIKTPYEVPNAVTQFHATKTPLRQGSYRALASTANNFARECVMDELAQQLGLDPVEFRLRNLKDDRLRAILEAVAKEIGWADRKAEKGRGFGIACGAEKGGYVATAVELTANEDTTNVKILRAVTGFECGAIINPDSLRNQVEGALIQGLGGALFEAIHFENGHITNPYMSDYRLPRFEDVPPIKCVLLDRQDLPSTGAGETPLIAIAPAISNAIAAATSKRLRSLPLLGSA